MLDDFLSIFLTFLFLVLFLSFSVSGIVVLTFDFCLFHFLVELRHICPFFTVICDFCSFCYCSATARALLALEVLLRSVTLTFHTHTTTTTHGTDDPGHYL